MEAPVGIRWGARIVSAGTSRVWCVGGSLLPLPASIVLAAILTPVAVSGQAELPPPVDRPVDFAADVQPILRDKCIACHGSSMQQARLRLDTVISMRNGGQSGPAIVVEDSAASLLIRRLVRSDLGVTMPPPGPLTSEQIGVLRAWIDQGAEWDVEISSGPARKVNLNAKKLFDALRDGDMAGAQERLDQEPGLIDASDADGSTPLMYAVLYLGPEEVKTLLERGADPNVANDAGATALIWGVDSLEKVRILLETGAEVDAKTAAGATALIAAARTPGSAPILRVLLDHGADVKAHTNRNSTALHSAAEAADIDGLTVLLDRGAEPNKLREDLPATVLGAAAVHGDAEPVRLLLERGADPNQNDPLQGSALVWAVYLSSGPEIVNLLVDAGTDVNAPGIGGYTALMWASYLYDSDPRVIRLLLENGADPSAKAKDGLTARDLALRRGDSKVAKLIEDFTENLPAAGQQ